MSTNDSTIPRKTPTFKLVSRESVFVFILLWKHETLYLRVQLNHLGL